MINIWRPVTIGTYRLKVGDVFTMHGEDPQNVVDRIAEEGFVVEGYKGMMLRDILNDYDDEDEVQCWTKSRDNSIKVRLAPNKEFSKPLPLP